MANSVDPDQMPHSAASDLVYTVCSDLSEPILRVNKTVYITCMYDIN